MERIIFIHMKNLVTINKGLEYLSTFYKTTFHTIMCAWEKYTALVSEPEFLNLLRSPGIDSQPGGIDSLLPSTFTNSGSEYVTGNFGSHQRGSRYFLIFLSYPPTLE